MSQPLASYAAIDEQSRGRRFSEPPPTFRSEFQRDRDRIIHSNAFRRLVYKTQVFVNHEGDLYRTRITHSLEVAQIGRTVARSLRINETLTEAICLAHDLGHTPFGHAGQDALNACMREYGGFEHNLQSLRVVDELEERYASFSGLNLTFECREGILKHCSLPNARKLGDVGQRFINAPSLGWKHSSRIFADAIAYNNHDVDDGVRAGLIKVEELRDVRAFSRFHAAVVEEFPDVSAASPAVRDHSPHGEPPGQRPHRDIGAQYRRRPRQTHRRRARPGAAADQPERRSARGAPGTEALPAYEALQSPQGQASHGRRPAPRSSCYSRRT
jgi:dGTPase